MLDREQVYLATGIVAMIHFCFFAEDAIVTFPDNLFVSSIVAGTGSREQEVPAPMVSLICAAVSLRT